MRIGSLCSGYGGLDLAVQQHYGAHVAWFAENDPHPATVYKRHWPDAPNHGDLTRIDWSAVEPVDIITAGYPCQPFSQAGTRKGKADERHLWPYIADAIRVLRPRIVVLENVTGHLSLGADDVLGDLAALGFDAQWGVVRASDAGACHRRARWFCVAHTDSRRPQEQLRHGAKPGLPEPCQHGGNGTAQLLPTPVVNDMGEGKTLDHWDQWAAKQKAADGTPAPHGKSLAIELERHTDFGPYAEAVRLWESTVGRTPPAPTQRGEEGRARLNAAFSEWMMGLPEGWVTDPSAATGNAPETQGDLFGNWQPDLGVPRSAQLKMLGNGVVPQQALLALSLLDGAA